MFLLIAIGFFLKRYGTQPVPLPTPSPASAAFSATILPMGAMVEQSLISYGAASLRRLHALGIGTSERTAQRRRRMDATISTCLSHVLLNTCAGVHDPVGFQAMARSSDDQRNCQRSSSGGVNRQKYVS